MAGSWHSQLRVAELMLAAHLQTESKTPLFITPKPRPHLHGQVKHSYAQLNPFHPHLSRLPRYLVSKRSKLLMVYKYTYKVCLELMVWGLVTV